MRCLLLCAVCLRTAQCQLLNESQLLQTLIKYTKDCQIIIEQAKKTCLNSPAQLSWKSAEVIKQTLDLLDQQHYSLPVPAGTTITAPVYKIDVPHATLSLCQTTQLSVFGMTSTNDGPCACNADFNCQPFLTSADAGLMLYMPGLVCSGDSASVSSEAKQLTVETIMLGMSSVNCKDGVPFAASCTTVSPIVEYLNKAKDTMFSIQRVYVNMKAHVDMLQSTV